jgi:AcrR family transcriptional regulator
MGYSGGMGLREINATRTKTMIIDAAMELIGERGYDAATMEDIAQRADIGVSTLYRYFPTKESVVIGLLGDPGMMAETLRDRPFDESGEVALGHALVDFLRHAGQDPDKAATLETVLEASARSRARLMEWFGDMHALLMVALEERLEGPAAGLQAGAMAWTAIFVLQRSAELAREDADGRDARVFAVDIMSTLAEHGVKTPRVHETS